MNRRLPALALISSLSGCGTMMNLRDADVPSAPPGEISIWTEGHHPAPKLVFGGVRLDAMAGPGWFVEASDTPQLALVGAYTCLVDLPVCVVTDTLTLPITIPAAIDRRTLELESATEADAQSVPFTSGNPEPSGGTSRFASDKSN